MVEVITLIYRYRYAIFMWSIVMHSIITYCKNKSKQRINNDEYSNQEQQSLMVLVMVCVDSNKRLENKDTNINEIRKW